MDAHEGILALSTDIRHRLHDAVKTRDCAAVRSLLRSVNPQQRDSGIRTALHVAAEVGATAIAAALVKAGFGVDDMERRLRTPLHICAQKGETGVALVLLQNGANTEQMEKDGRTPLHFCAESGSNEIAVALLNERANVNAVDKDEATALHICCRKRRTQIALTLLERGADVQAADKDGVTPLHICARNNLREIASALIERNANVDALEKHRWTPLHLCTLHGSADVAKALIERGASVAIANNVYWTALQIAAKNGRLDMLKVLLENRADPKAQDDEGNSALHLAVMYEHSNCAYQLLETATDDLINLKNGSGQTALHIAVLLRSESMMRMLIEFGASPNVRDKAERTPVDNLSSDQAAAFRDLLAISQETPAAPVDETPKEVASFEETTEAVHAASSSDERHRIQPPARFSAGNFQKDFGSTSRKGHNIAVRGLFPMVEDLSNEDDSSSSSESEDWTPDVPFGRRGRMLRKLKDLRPGCVFADDYIIEASSFTDKSHIRVAREKLMKKRAVILKFYWNESLFENMIDVHSNLSQSEHICSAMQSLKTQKTSYPPCIVYEMGTQTLDEWLQQEERSPIEKKWCLSQILTGLKDLHSGGTTIHGNLKLTSIMLAGGGITWKLCDLDGAGKVGVENVTHFTAAYTAPEVMKAWNGERRLPVAQQSLDLWAFGVIAYEVIKGERFYGKDDDPETVYEQIETGRVEQNLGRLWDQTEKELLSGFLEMDPAKRWSADVALQHDFFQTDSCTTSTTLQLKETRHVHTATKDSRSLKAWKWIWGPFSR